MTHIRVRRATFFSPNFCPPRLTETNHQPASRIAKILQMDTLDTDDLSVIHQ